MKTRAIALCVALLGVGAALVSVAPIVAAATVTFTSTADFDGGTKSNPGDGNYGVETVTDNLGIAAGGFELSSMKGDSFTLADADGDTFKWDFAGLGGCTGGTPTRSISGGVYNMLSSGGQAGVVSGHAVSGVVDVRLKIDHISSTGGGKDFWLLNEPRCNQGSATVDGVLYDAVTTSNIWGAFTMTNGVLTQCGTNTDVGVDPVYLRFTFNTPTWTFYYSSDGSAWTQDEQCTNAVTGPWYTVFSLSAGADFDLDDYHLASGTVDAGGFRTTGDWRSATQTYAGAAVVTVDITYSGASATGFIDDVAIVSSADVVLWNDGTDQTSGTSASYTVSPAVTQDWKVRVTLGGSNAATATLESIVVTTNANPTAVATASEAEPCIGESVAFSSAASTDSDGTIASYLWDFGDGATSTLANPDHAFPFNSIFTVTLTVTDNAGGTGQTTLSVPVQNCQLPGRVLEINIACAYNPFVQFWSCTDRTDYKGWVLDVFDRMTFSYDGREVASVRSRGATVTFESGGSVVHGDSDHLLIVTWHLFNGGTPSATYVLRVDNRPMQVTLAIAGLVLLFAIVAAVIRRRGGAIAYEPVQNPSYRRWPSEEFPKGWRTYRRVPHRSDLPTRSERRGNLWVIYQVRPATAAEQQRTGRKRVAYVQAVREKM